MFRSSVMSMTNLRLGMEVKGCVVNVTTFGAFVDIGVEETAFVPLQFFPPPPFTSAFSSGCSNVGGSFGSRVGKGGNSFLRKLTLQYGDRVTARVEALCYKTKRISLRDVRLIVD